MSKLSRFSLKTKMDEINYFNDFYSDMFSLNFDNLFSTVDLESHDMKENDTVVEVDNTLNRPSERAVLTETNMETNNLPAPDESRFPLSSNEQIQETVKQAENKNTNRSTATWMKVWSSWAKSRNIDVNMETFGARNFGRVWNVRSARSQKAQVFLSESVDERTSLTLTKIELSL